MEFNKAYDREVFLTFLKDKYLPEEDFVKGIDAGFRFSIVNDYFTSFYGFTSAEIIGKYDKDISTPEQAKSCYITDSIASKHDISSPLISVEEIPISPKSVKYKQTIKFSIVKNQYEKQIENKKLDFVYIPHDKTNHVYSNKDCIIELMKHFLDNALKFTEHGTISMGYDLEDKGVKIWVKDTGIGIDKKNKKNVFKRFVKLNDFTPGTGIGLYIAQKIAKALKGKIGLNSEVGKGTYIWAELPV